MSIRIIPVHNRPPPQDWVRAGHADGKVVMAWAHDSQPKVGDKPKTGKQNAIQGTCPILGHRYRSNMERRFGMYLLFLGYRRWKDKAADPPADGKWYGYERREWEFPGIKGANYRYTADYECWPGLPDPLRPGAPPSSYVVYEVKGYMNDSDNVRAKRMTKHYPEVPVVVVESDLFDQYTHGAALVVPGWNDVPGREGAR